MSWVDEYPSGILSESHSDKKAKKVITPTQAAFNNFDNMLEPKKDEKSEEYSNYKVGKKRLKWWQYLIYFLVVLIFLIIASKKKMYIKYITQ